MKPQQIAAIRSRTISQASACLEYEMRAVLALCLSIALCASANAATRGRHREPHKGQLRPAQPVAAPKGYAVPGWTEQQTRDWMNSYRGGTD